MNREILQSWSKKDFDIKWFSGTGAGGQHRNKHQNCVQLTHKDSGLSAVGQSSKSRQQNLREALYTLAGRLKEYYYPESAKPRAPVTDVVRTYNVPDNRVKDHESNVEMSFSNLDFDLMICERKRSL